MKTSNNTDRPIRNEWAAKQNHKININECKEAVVLFSNIHQLA